MFRHVALVVLLTFGLATYADAQMAPNPGSAQQYKQYKQQQQYKQQHQQQQQQQQQQRLAQMQPHPFTINNGTLTSSGGATLHVLDSSQQAWQVNVSKDAKVHVVGAADASYLKKGLGVELTAKLDADGKGQENVGSLKIISVPRDKSQMGVFSTSGAQPPGKPVGGKPAAGGKGGAEKKAAIQEGTNRVVGQITSLRGNELIIRAGRSTVTVERTDDPKIAVDMADLSAAAHGDKITVQGMTTFSESPASPLIPMAQGHQNNRMGAGQPVSHGQRIIQANDVKIDLAAPLTGKKKPVVKTPPKTTAKSKKGSAGMEKPAESHEDASPKASDDEQ